MGSPDTHSRVRLLLGVQSPQLSPWLVEVPPAPWGDTGESKAGAQQKELRARRADWAQAQHLEPCALDKYKKGDFSGARGGPQMFEL